MMEKTLNEGLNALGLSLPQERQETLCAFARAMVKQNEVMNLTAITEDAQVAKLHLLDSLTVLCCADLKGKTLIDVGCGAGFPGVPLAIACPEANITLLDSLGKRVKWLEQILPQLGIHAECVTARAEEAVASRRESYDFATSRAVAALPLLSELCLPLVKPGGWFLAMKAVDSDEELRSAAHAIETLGGQLVRTENYQIPGIDVSHRLVFIKKIKETPKKYPRPFAKIKKNPL